MDFMIRTLSEKEMSEINGDGLIEDIGYGCHYLYDKAGKAYNYVKKKVCDLMIKTISYSRDEVFFVPRIFIVFKLA